jgi:phosphomannomutase/phosphoglucomutase
MNDFISPHIFREYDIRGEVASEFTPEVVYCIAEAASRLFAAAGEERVLIGRDNRLHGTELRHALVAGLHQGGMRVVDLGVLISPAFYWARHHLGVNPGIMLTASHNPAEFNGMKVALGPSTIYGADIQRLYELAKECSPPTLPIKANPCLRADINSAYIDMLVSKLQLGPRKLRVVVDCGNGTASLYAEEYLQRLGCQVIPLYCESDGNFPNHHPDPTQTKNLVDLRQAVLENKADVGIGFDGDGDRIGVVDDTGEVVWGDKLMVLFWQEILQTHPGAPAIIEVKCSQALVDEVERMGGKPFYYKTGHSLIKAKMHEINALFAGEMSGHMFFADEYFGFDDALYAAGRLLRILSNTEESLSQRISRIPVYYSTAETRVPCPDTEKFAVVESLTAEFKKTHQVIDVDGARVLFPDGWGLVRCSNTQPVIVARCEGTSPEALQRICGIMKDGLRQYLAVADFEWQY